VLYVHHNITMSANILSLDYLRNIFIFRAAMAGRRKLSIGQRENSNEGRQSIPTNLDSTNVQGSNGAETGSCPSHIESVIHESVESHFIHSDIEAGEEERIVEGINYIPFSILFICLII